MTWLRIDDGFDEHPKFAGWSAAEKWRWLQVMLWCARQRTNGRVPTLPPIARESRRTSALYAKAVESGLLDVVGDELWIHDWALYNGDLAARVAAYCEKYPQATANDVLRFTGGTRATVLQLVREYRAGGSVRGSGRTVSTVENDEAALPQSGSMSGTGPQPHQELPAVSPSRSGVRRAREAPTDGLTPINDDDLQQALDEARARDEGMP